MAGERTLPGLGLTGYWDLGDNTWKDGMDVNLRLLSLLVQAHVDSSVATEPGAPVDGEVYRATGAWASGQTDGQIVIRDNGAWVAFNPEEGWMFYDRAANVLLQYDGAAWAEFEAGGGGAAVSKGGVEVLPAPTDLNFTGTGVSVTDDGDGSVTIDIPGGSGGGGGGGGEWVFRGARAGLSADQSIPSSTTTLVDLDTEVFDDGGFFDPATPGRFTVPAGVSRVTVSAGYRISSGGTSQDEFIIRKNGTIVAQSRANPSGYGALTVTTGVLDVVEGDYLEFQIWSTTSRTLQADRVWASIEEAGGSGGVIAGGGGGTVKIQPFAQPVKPPVAAVFATNGHGTSPVLTTTADKMTVAADAGTDGMVYASGLAVPSELTFHHKNTNSGIHDDDGVVFIGSNGQYLSVGIGGDAGGDRGIRVLEWDATGGFITTHGSDGLDIRNSEAYFHVVFSDHHDYLSVYYSEDAVAWTLFSRVPLSVIGGSVVNLGFRAKQGQTTEYKFWRTPDDEYEIAVGGGGGGGGGGTVKGAALDLTTATVIASTTTTLDFDAAKFDNGGWWSVGAPSRLTVPAGVEYVSVTAGTRADQVQTSTQDYAIKILKNGVVIVEYTVDNQFWGPPPISTGILKVAEGDYFELQLWSNNNWELEEDKTFFAIEAITAGQTPVAITEETGTDYPITDADLAGNVVKKINNAAANTVTVNPGLTGTEPVTIASTGAGQTSLVAGGGVTIQSPDGMLKLRTQFSTATLLPLGADTYLLMGDLAV